MAENQLVLVGSHKDLKKIIDQPDWIAKYAATLGGQELAKKFAACVLNAVAKVPALQFCTQLSFFRAVMQAAECALMPNTPLQHACIIPYGKDATFQIMYQGLIELAYRSNRISSIYAYNVYSEDDFEYQFGTSPYIKHLPAKKNKGDLLAVYAVVKLKGAVDPVFIVLDKTEVYDQHRAHSKSWQSIDKRKYSPWATQEPAMFLKSAIIVLSKFLPHCPDLQTAVNQAEEAEYDIEKEPKDTLKEMFKPQSAEPPEAAEFTDDTPPPESDPLPDPADEYRPGSQYYLLKEIKKVKDALKKATGTDDAYYAEIAGYQIEEAGTLRPCKKSKEITPDFRKILLEKLQQILIEAKAEKPKETLL